MIRPGVHGAAGLAPALGLIRSLSALAACQTLARGRQCPPRKRGGSPPSPNRRAARAAVLDAQLAASRGGDFVGAMTQRAIHAFMSLPLLVRFLWFFAMFEALSMLMRLAIE